MLLCRERRILFCFYLLKRWYSLRGPKAICWFWLLPWVGCLDFRWRCLFRIQRGRWGRVFLKEFRLWCFLFWRLCWCWFGRRRGFERRFGWRWWLQWYVFGCPWEGGSWLVRWTQPWIRWLLQWRHLFRGRLWGRGSLRWVRGGLWSFRCRFKHMWWRRRTCSLRLYRCGGKCLEWRGH